MLGERARRIQVSDDGRVAWLGGARGLRLGRVSWPRRTRGLPALDRRGQGRGPPAGGAGREVKVSLRGKGEVPVNRIAHRFGGGGHENAAGCTVPGRSTRPPPPCSRRCARRSTAPPRERRGRAPASCPVEKGPGVTSFQVVAHRRRSCAPKIGHGGTLDPEATGLLPDPGRRGDQAHALSGRARQGIRGDGAPGARPRTPRTCPARCSRPARARARRRGRRGRSRLRGRDPPGAAHVLRAPPRRAAPRRAGARGRGGRAPGSRSRSTPFSWKRSPCPTS